MAIRCQRKTHERRYDGGIRRDTARRAVLRPLRDRMVVKPMEWDASSTIIAIRHGRAVRGRVVAIGPGAYRKKYSKDRSKVSETTVFVPAEVKPGDIVELGGLNIFDGRGYAFPEVIIDGEVHILCQEQDVCVVRDDLKSLSQ